MSMIQQLHRHVLLPAYEVGWHRRGTFRYLHDLELSERCGEEELRLRQFEALRKLLEHCAETCPYYRDEWLNLGIHPSTIDSVADFAAWPMITRETVHANRLQMRSNRPDLRLIAKSTGGSSGAPLQFDMDQASNDRKMAAWHRGYGWAGAGLGTKQFYLWGAPVGTLPWRNRWKDALYHRLYRRKVVNCFGLSDDRVGWFLGQLNHHRPEAIVAYTNPLYFFARALEERGLKPWQPRTIVVGAEKLHAFQRELIERVFQAPVFETYGSREFMLMGAECPEHSGLHLTMENVLVEILDEDGRPTAAGLEGNVVITDLTNYGMPFIRYQNGDRATAGFSACKCGRSLPLLSQVVGRRLDTLRTPDGRLVPGEFFVYLLKDFAAVRRFQVVQWGLDDVELRIVRGKSWGAGECETVNEKIQMLLGDAVQFRMTEVDEIALTAAGKLRVVLSHCSDHETPANAI